MLHPPRLQAHLLPGPCSHGDGPDREVGGASWPAGSRNKRLCLSALLQAVGHGHAPATPCSPPSPNPSQPAPTHHATPCPASATGAGACPVLLHLDLRLKAGPYFRCRAASALPSPHPPPCRYGVFDCKPLAFIWAKFPEFYNESNTIMMVRGPWGGGGGGAQPPILFCPIMHHHIAPRPWWCRGGGGVLPLTACLVVCACACAPACTVPVAVHHAVWLPLSQAAELQFAAAAAAQP